MVSADHVGSPSRTHYRVVHVQMLMQLLCLTDESRQSHTLLVEPAVAQLLSETRRNGPALELDSPCRPDQTRIGNGCGTCPSDPPASSTAGLPKN